MTGVLDRLRPERTLFSVEFSPPRDDEDERLLWEGVRELEQLDPAFVSVTYGPAGSSRRRTLRTTSRIARETSLLPVAHLTGVGHSAAELERLVDAYGAEGVRNVLAIRGDPPGDPSAAWVPHPRGIRHADELVRLVRGRGEFSVGVAAFPYMHPSSPDVEEDTRRLVNKIRSGADFAVSQVFLQADYFVRMRDRLALRGCHVPVFPGVVPITTPRVLDTFAGLSGVGVPDQVARRLDPLREDPAAFRAEGLALTTELCQRLVSAGVPGIHFCSLNRASATREVVRNLGISQGVLQPA